MTTIINLRTEYRQNPLGIDATPPRLSWQMNTDRPGARQSAYQVLAASDPAKLTPDAADLWDSGLVQSDQSVQVAYGGPALQSRQRVYWRVHVHDETGAITTSDPAWFEMGLLGPADWQAEWITTKLVGGAYTSVPVPYMRRTFEVSGAVRSARLYITALGIFEASINGQAVGEDVFAPGWTEYDERLQYLVYDVTDHLHSGPNALGVVVADGWAVGYVGLNHRQMYADRPALLAQLEITLDDGSTQVITSDAQWRLAYGPLLEADLIQGESYDARLEMPGWNTPDFDASDWDPVQPHDGTAAALVATNGPTVRRQEELTPITDPDDRSTPLSRSVIFDLGQNMVGWVRFMGSAPAGTTITLRFAEVLNPDGTIYTDNLRGARATDHYTFKGEGVETWEPSFTFHGFRYVELTGYAGEVTRETITGVVAHSDMAVTGDFSCSNELLNQLQRNIRWGQKGNFIDVPTDCPQRDERLGWTGDIQVFAQTAAFNMDVIGFMTKWARDVDAAQNEQGMIPAVVPHALKLLPDGGPAWADAVIICPWAMYRSYNDRRILAENYDTMQRFMQFLLNTSPDLIRCPPGYPGWPGFGDWLSINAPTPRDLIGTAFLAYDAHLMQQIATLLDKSADAARYAKLHADVKGAFQERFLHGSSVTVDAAALAATQQAVAGVDAISQGTLNADYEETASSQVFNTALFNPTQTAYVLALHFDLLPDELVQPAVDELVAAIERRDMHLSTGFVGSPYLPHVLSQHGRADVAYTLLLQETWPSWLYSVTQGGTTIWERWDGWTEDNGFQDAGMNSFNHYAYGAIGEWLYNTVVGLRIDDEQPGYKHAIIAPHPGGGLTHAQAHIDTAYGRLQVAWEQTDAQFTLSVTVPPNTTATVHLPFDDPQQVQHNEAVVNGTTHTITAGRHRFSVRP